MKILSQNRCLSCLSIVYGVSDFQTCLYSNFIALKVSHFVWNSVKGSFSLNCAHKNQNHVECSKQSSSGKIRFPFQRISAFQKSNKVRVVQKMSSYQQHDCKKHHDTVENMESCHHLLQNSRVAVDNPSFALRLLSVYRMF